MQQLGVLANMAPASAMSSGAVDTFRVQFLPAVLLHLIHVVLQTAALTRLPRSSS